MYGCGCADRVCVLGTAAVDHFDISAFGISDGPGRLVFLGGDPAVLYAVRVLPALQAALVVYALCAIPAMTRMARKVLELLHSDTLEFLQVAFLMAQVCWGLFGAVAANLHTVRILLVLHAAPNMYALHTMPAMFA